MKHTLAWYDGDTNTVKIDYRPVHDYTMTDGIECHLYRFESRSMDRAAFFLEKW